MSDARSIGVFDSGVGGLTVLRALRAALPGESTVYLGDTARVPYGTRSAQTVITYAKNNARTLVAHSDVKALVVACNTVSAVALDALRETVAVPVVGVIEPGARAALLASSTTATIAVLGTQGTVRSGAYARTLAALGHTGTTAAVACPLLVPLAEEGWTSGTVPELVVDRYLSELPARVDVVILGCTHYPLLQDVICARLAAARPGSVVVDGAAATARAVAEIVTPAPAAAAGAHRILVTDAPQQMATLGPAFLGAPVNMNAVELVDVLMTA
jgi:glutamate racemase